MNENRISYLTNWASNGMEQKAQGKISPDSFKKRLKNTYQLCRSQSRKHISKALFQPYGRKWAHQTFPFLPAQLGRWMRLVILYSKVSCSSSRDRCVLFPKSLVGLLHHFYIQKLPFSAIPISLPDVTNNIGPKWVQFSNISNIYTFISWLFARNPMLGLPFLLCHYTYYLGLSFRPLNSTVTSSMN